MKSKAIITPEILDKLSKGGSITINLPPNCSEVVLSLQADEDVWEKFGEVFSEFSKAIQKTFKNTGLRR